MARYAGGGKRTVESCRCISVLDWHRRGYLQSPRSFSWEWTENGERVAWIQVQSDHDRVYLKYSVRSYGEDWTDVEQGIPVAWTPCRFGGERPWFMCSVASSGRPCWRRVIKLYGAGRLFACRHCYRLAYASQQESARERGLLKSQRIRARLGGSRSILDPFPDKPKGMHWRTYDRLDSLSAAAERRATVGMMRALERVDRRLRR